MKAFIQHSFIMILLSCCYSTRAFQFSSRHRRAAAAAIFNRSNESSSPSLLLLRMSTTTSETENKFANRNNIRDQVFSAISKCGGIKVTVATTRNLLNDIMIMQNMNPVPADAFGRLMNCSLLMSNGMQDEQTCELTMESDGVLRGCTVITTGKGETRGFVGNPSIGNAFTLQDAIGQGAVQVVKMHPDWARPYNGITAIGNGDVDSDIGSYLASSEQRSCAISAGTVIDGILCKASGGYLVERLPDCDEESMSTVQNNLAKLVKSDGTDAAPTNLLAAGATPYDITEQILEGIGMQPLNEITPVYKCRCSDESLIRSVRLLGKEECEKILDAHGAIEGRCEFCTKVYRIGPDEMKQALERTDDPSVYTDKSEE